LSVIVRGAVGGSVRLTRLIGSSLEEAAHAFVTLGCITFLQFFASGKRLFGANAGIIVLEVKRITDSTIRRTTSVIITCGALITIST
jgi:hypothetical protein